MKKNEINFYSKSLNFARGADTSFAAVIIAPIVLCNSLFSINVVFFQDGTKDISSWRFAVSGEKGQKRRVFWCSVKKEFTEF